MARLLINIDGDSSGFANAVTKVEARARAMYAKIEGDSKRSLARSIGSAFALTAGVSVSKSVMDAASSFNDLSDATGETTDRMQELNYAATQNGSSIENMVVMLRNLRNARLEALKNPGGDKAATFRTLGISPEELASFDKASDLAFRLSDSLKGVAMDSDSIPPVLDLIGQKNGIVLPAMIAGLRAAADEARAMNAVMSVDTVKSLDALGDQIDRQLLGLRKPFSELLVFVLRAIDVTVHTITTLFRDIIPGNVALAMGGLLEALSKSPLGKLEKRLNQLTGNQDAGTLADDAARLKKFAAEREKANADSRNELLNRYDTGKAKNRVRRAFGIPEGAELSDMKTTEEIRVQAQEAQKLADIYRDIEEIETRRRRLGMDTAQEMADMVISADRLKKNRDVAASQGASAVELAEFDKKIAEVEFSIEQKRVELQTDEQRRIDEALKPKDLEPTEIEESSSLAKIGGFVGGELLGISGIISPQRETTLAVRDVERAVGEVEKAIQKLPSRYSGPSTGMDPYA